MKTSTKVILALTLAFLGVGFLFQTGVFRPDNLPIVYAVLPVGAILAGLFMVYRLLEKEVEQYDKEHASALARVQVHPRAKKK